ncbi:MAG: ABC transporter substrate-binding protein [Candidatus Natronoplasma sp.]
MEKKSLFAVFGAILLITSGLTFAGCIQDTEEEGLEIGVQVTHTDIVVYWDPSHSYSNEITMMHNAYETLTRYDPDDDELKGVLAEDWEVSDDSLTWSFELKEGVKFHDGTEMTAEDVKFSFERTIEEEAGASFLFSAVDEITAVDDYTVEFEVNEPTPLDMLSASSYGGFIYSKSKAEEVDNYHDWFNEHNTAGTGPYQVDEYVQGERLVMKRHDDYRGEWKEDQVDQVIIRKISDATTRRHEIESGEVDIIERLPYEQYTEAEKDENVEVVKTESFQNILGMFNTESEPFDDIHFREAVSWAVPYDDIVEEVYHGDATQARGAIPHGMWGHAEDLDQFEMDMEKAEDALNQSEYNPEDIEIDATYTSGNSAQERILSLMQAQLDELGIDMSIRGMEWSAQWEKARHEDPDERQDLFVFYWWPDEASPYSWLSNLFMSEEEPYFNLAYYSNEEVDNLTQEAREKAGIDRDQAADMYIEAQQEIMKDVPSLFLMDEMYMRTVRSEINGYEDNPAYPNVVFWYDITIEE